MKNLKRLIFYLFFGIKILKGNGEKNSESSTIKDTSKSEISISESDKVVLKGPVMSSSSFEKNIKENKFLTIMKRICPSVNMGDKCNTMISDLENGVTTRENENIAVLPGGTFGTLYKLNSESTIKVIHVKDKQPLIFALQEINIGRKIYLSKDYKTVDNLLPIVDCCSEMLVNREGSEVKIETFSFFITLPKIHHQNLREFMFDFSNVALTTNYKWKLDILKGIANGVRLLHKEKYAHRDLKPDNIYLTSPIKPMLSDFQFARNNLYVEDINVGTSIYMAPETHQAYNKPSTKVDIYNLGILMFEVLNSNSYRLTENIKEDIKSYCPDFEDDGLITGMSYHEFEKYIYCKLFHYQILLMMHDDPDKRPDIFNIIEFLSNTKSSIKPLVDVFEKYIKCDEERNLKLQIAALFTTNKKLQWGFWHALVNNFYCEELNKRRLELRI